MGVRHLEHYNLLTLKFDETLDFYSQVLGMKFGPAPSGNVKEGAWIYDIDGTAVVHVQRVDPADPERRFGLVRKRMGDLVEPLTVGRLSGGGAVEHVAFDCDDYDGFVSKFEKSNRFFTRNDVASLNLRQLFVNDPNGVTLELNFRGALD